MPIHMPAVLALAPELVVFGLLAGAVALYNLLKWAADAKAKQGQRQGPGAGSSGRAQAEEMAQRRRQQLMALSQQRGKAAPTNLSMREKEARDHARAIYEARAEALRRPTAAPQARPAAAARPAPAPARRPVQALSRPAPQPARRPAPPAPPRRVAPLDPEPVVVLEEDEDTATPGIQAALNAPAAPGAPAAPILRGSGVRPGLRLNRNVMRQAVILREILDQPVSLRPPRSEI